MVTNKTKSLEILLSLCQCIQVSVSKLHGHPAKDPEVNLRDSSEKLGDFFDILLRVGRCCGSQFTPGQSKSDNESDKDLCRIGFCVDLLSDIMLWVSARCDPHFTFNQSRSDESDKKSSSNSRFANLLYVCKQMHCVSMNNHNDCSVGPSASAETFGICDLSRLLEQEQSSATREQFFSLIEKGLEDHNIERAHRSNGPFEVIFKDLITTIVTTIWFADGPFLQRDLTCCVATFKHAVWEKWSKSGNCCLRLKSVLLPQHVHWTICVVSCTIYARNGGYLLWRLLPPQEIPPIARIYCT